MSRRRFPRHLGGLRRWRFADLQLRSKIMTALVLVMLIGLGATGLSLWQLRAMSQRLDRVSGHNVAALRALDQARAGLQQTYVTEVNYLSLRQIAPEKTNMGDELVTLRDADVRVDDAIDAYIRQSGNSSPEVTAAFKEQIKRHRKLRFVLYQMGPSDDPDVPREPQAAHEAFIETNQQMDRSLELLFAAENRESDAAAEAGRSTYRTAVLTLLAAAVLGLAAAVVLGLYLTGLIVGPIRRVSAALDAVAEGDLTHVVEAGGGDEVGQMARAVNRATRALRETVQAVAVSAGTLATNAGRLTALSDQVAVSARTADTQAAEADTAAAQVRDHLRSVSAGAEELGCSINEISRSTCEGAKVVAEAVEIATAANETIASLGRSSAQIGSVIRTITAIAEQTNLLALNATIEAARAGAAGRGFAIVAAEVKELAQESAAATGDVSQRIEAIQADAERAVSAIDRIGRIVETVNRYQTTIAAAVEQQAMTTGDMGRTISSAADGGGRIASNISTVAEAVRQTAESTGTGHAAAAELARMSGELNGLVARFRY